MAELVEVCTKSYWCALALLVGLCSRRRQARQGSRRYSTIIVSSCRPTGPAISSTLTPATADSNLALTSEQHCSWRRGEHEALLARLYAARQLQA